MTRARARGWQFDAGFRDSRLTGKERRERGEGVPCGVWGAGCDFVEEGCVWKRTPQIEGGKSPPANSRRLLRTKKEPWGLLRPDQPLVPAGNMGKIPSIMGWDGMEHERAEGRKR